MGAPYGAGAEDTDIIGTEEMKAIVVNDYGGAETLSFADVPIPEPGDGEVLVKLAYAGVNFIDVYIRGGLYARSRTYAQTPPMVIGMEGAGEVAALGPGAGDLAEGDRVLFREKSTAGGPEAGQTILDFAVTELAEKIAPLVHASAPHAKAQASTGDDWFDLGLEFDQVGSREDACAAYREALTLDPDHVNARINLGRLLHNDRAYRQAEELYRETLRIDPANPIAAFNLGVVLEDQGAIQEALETYQHALAVDATIPDVHYNIARLYEHQGDQRAALHHFSRCKALLQSQQDD